MQILYKVAFKSLRTCSQNVKMTGFKFNTFKPIDFYIYSVLISLHV